MNSIWSHEMSGPGFGSRSWASLRGALGKALVAAEIGIWRAHVPSGLGTWDSVSSRITGGEGVSQEEPVPLPIHPEDQGKAKAWFEQSLAGHGPSFVVVRIVSNAGEIRWVRATAREPSGDGADGEWLIGIIADVTGEVLADAKLQESQRQLSSLIDHLPGVAYRCAIENPWRMTYISRGAEALTGYPAADYLEGRRGWADIMHPDDLPATGRTIRRSMREQESFEISYRIRTASGALRWVQERGRAFYDEAGNPRFLEGFIWDISEAKAAVEQAHWIANHDSLTGLPNRLLFQEALNARADRAGAPGYAVLLLDLDDFKRTNDTLGHDSGDALLVEFAKRLKTTIRDGDLVARLGGDEFAIILDSTEREAEVMQFGERIFDALGAPFEHSSGVLACSASIGASICPKDGRCRTEMLKHADIALYAAKAAGRGNLKTFRRSMWTEINRRNSMLGVARQALAADAIVPLYQPKVHLASGEIDGFEALLRWRSTSGGLRLPKDLAAAFDDPVLAMRIGDSIMASVIADIRHWLQSGVHFGHVALNASAVQFRRGDFADRLLGQLHASGVPTANVQVEVTETVFLGRGARYVERALADLSAAGVKIALDDFGTGYASLLHLAQFPVSTLKIDRSFVAKILTSEHDAAIVRAVVNLGHSLGMAVVAEGIETLQQEVFLQAKGCDFGQGYLYAHAMRASDVALLASDRLPHKFAASC